ncbi:MAG: outer membrane beta-barrel protein [Paludibacteraceae bacterium]|nr:outer membrane beta-barrel protein [Paludibacteraceae bacterium]
MKKLFLTLSFMAFVTMTVCAQDSSWRFEPTEKRDFGFTFAWITKQYKYDGNKYAFLTGKENKFSHGLRVGFVANPTFKYGLGFRTGLNVEYCYAKTTRIENDEMWHNEEFDMYLHDFALSVPLQPSFRMEVAKDFQILIYTGPVFDFEVCQLTRIHGETLDDYYKDADDKWDGFNCLWGVGGGIQYKCVRVDAGTEFGLVKKKDMLGDTFKWNKPVYVALSFLF